MNFKIHRGTKEIGGSCVEIWTTETRIVVDFGIPLVNADKSPFDTKQLSALSQQELIDKGILPNIQNLYQPNTKTALILSHAHQDHYGLINYLHDACPVFLGEATHKLIEITNIFNRNKDWKIAYPNYFVSGKSFWIGDIEITPYLMDHSAFDAYAFMIKANGKSLFYSGYFRIHGKKTKAFDWFSNNVDKNVDYLLLEGTAINRPDKKFITETEIEKEFIKTFKQSQGINLIYTSGQNIDRLVSIYRACKQTSKIMVVDFYIATILKNLSLLGTKIPYPSNNFPEIKVFFPYRLSRMITNQGNEKLIYQFQNYKITKEEIDNRFKDVVMIVRPSMLKDLEDLENLNHGMFTYSMWSGYKDDDATKEFISFLKARGISENELHTSGHADIEGLKRMEDALKPKKIIPIHTFDRDEYQKIFVNTKIEILDDAEEVEI